MRDSTSPVHAGTPLVRTRKESAQITLLGSGSGAGGGGGVVCVTAGSWGVGFLLLIRRVRRVPRGHAHGVHALETDGEPVDVLCLRETEPRGRAEQRSRRSRAHTQPQRSLKEAFHEIGDQHRRERREQREQCRGPALRFRLRSVGMERAGRLRGVVVEDLVRRGLVIPEPGQPAPWSGPTRKRTPSRPGAYHRRSRPATQRRAATAA